MAVTLLRNTHLLPLILVFLIGCDSPAVNFQAKIDPSYHGKLEKVLIVSDNEELSARLEGGFWDRVLTRLAESLAQKNVTSEIIHVNKEDLDPFVRVKSAVDRFGPKQLFYIEVTQVLASTLAQQYGSGSIDSAPLKYPLSITISFRLENWQSQKTVWRGEAHFDPPPHPADIVDQLFKQLETENLF